RRQKEIARLHTHKKMPRRSGAFSFLDSGELRRRRAHEIALADLDAALADDVVGGGGVEIEVRQGVAEQQALAGELADLPAREGDLDFLALGAVDLALLHTLEILDGLGDPVLQLHNGGLVVGEFQKLLAGQPSRRVGEIGRASCRERWWISW